MQDLIGVLLILVSGISFGAAAVFARFAYEAGTNPITLLFLRFGISSVCMLVLTLARGTKFPRGRTLLGLMLMGALGYFGQSFCYFTALTFISAGLVALLLYSYPAIVTVLAVALLKESISTLKIVALALALAGTALTIGAAGGGKPLGVLLSLGAAFIYSVYILAGSKIIGQGTAIPSSTVIITSAAVMYSGLIAIKGVSFPTTWFGWVSVSGVALISTVLAVVTFLAGLERVGPANAAVLSTIEPVVTVILAAAVLDEAITPLRIAGGVMILLAVILLTRSRLAVRERPSTT